VKIHYKILIVCILLLTAIGCQSGTEIDEGEWSSVTLEGAGASFPYPIYSAWAFEFEEITGLRINYQSVGSGAGVSSIQSKTVDFGASDAPLEAEELDEYGLLQFPMIIGGVVPVINVEGIGFGELKLSEEALAGIFLGQITRWNDPVITEANPGMAIPDEPLTVIHRADGSGTTWIFSGYMSAISSEWEETVGTGKALEWPVGMGGRGNEGVASLVTTVEGSIGYVEYAYAIQNELNYCQLENSDGNFVSPKAENFESAAANADWENAPGFYMVLVDQPGADTWPIVGASFILIYKEQEDYETVRAMLEFFDWCFMEGDSFASELDYVTIPDSVVTLIEEKWRSDITAGDQPVWE